METDKTKDGKDGYLKELAELTQEEKIFFLQSQGVAITIGENIRSWEAAYESLYSRFLLIGCKSQLVEVFNKKAHDFINEMELLFAKFHA